MIFQVQSKPYSGPMDLLLDLVTQSKIDIYEINISQITEQFLEAMQRVSIPADELSDFIRMASLLVLMKARTLIQDQEDEKEDLPSREELIRRLKEYQIYKEGAQILKDKWEKAREIFTKLPEDPGNYQVEEDPPLPTDPQALKDSLLALLNKKKEKEDRTFEVQGIINKEEDSIEKVAKLIQEKLLTGKYFTFNDLMDSLSWTKPKMIAAFLSLLEISRKDSIRLKQDHRSGKIKVEVIDFDLLAKSEDIFHDSDKKKGGLGLE